MSKTIDEKIVKMEFDNKDFERNVQGTLGSLDKLKQSLQLPDSTKGLDNLQKTVRGFDMNPLIGAVETVRVRFSALQIMAKRTLENITDSAVYAGKTLVKSLTIDQVTSGWNKYAQKTASVQTLMNSTGKTIDEINGYLDKLMWYSDETSYGFTDMTAALATMSASGR